MTALTGRVAIITGAGRGLGRAHALLFAAEGAAVVVNDVGSAPDGAASDAAPANEVVEEIVAAGGAAVAHTEDVADAAGAQSAVDLALEAFGRLDVLVNNAGILRDRMLVTMEDADWDDVIRVHLRGHVMPLRAAARHWRSEHKRTGEPRGASVINTTSTSGLFGLVGQTNYGTAKMGIAGMTQIAQMELGRYGVRVNAIAPAARTRLTADIPGSAERERAAADLVARTGWDPRDPGNVSPFTAYLATEGCRIAGRIFYVRGGQVKLLQPYSVLDGIEKEGRWTVSELEVEAAHLADVPLGVVEPTVPAIPAPAAT